MESQRSFLFIALAVVSFMLFNAWQTDHQPKPAPVAVTAADAANAAAELPAGNSLPTGSAQAPAESVKAPVSADLITVTTDTLELRIDPRGGDIVSTQLLAYPETLDPKSPPFRVLRNDEGRVYSAQSGLVGKDGPDAQVERPLYASAERSYRLADGQNELNVDLQYTDSKGIRYTKRFHFLRGEYRIDVGYTIKNLSAEPLSMQLFTQLKRDRVEAAKPSGFGTGAVTYLGGAYSSAEERFKKYSFSDMDKANLAVTTPGGWVAMLQHYFVAAWVPAQDQQNQLYSKNTAGLAIMGALSQSLNIAPGVEAKTGATLYVGPKIQKSLEAIAPHLNLVVDYGILWWLGQPLFWLLTHLHALVSNWGVAIILLTLIVRGGMYKLTAIQYRSSAKMRQLQPKLNALKERYGDDRQKFGQAMMELYKKEKVNPLAGCFPIIIQMPVFLALYWVLLESVELRHAPFMFWLHDLSAKDPYFVLPVLYGLSMFVVTRMQPTPPNMDPTQAKMMQMMPLAMSALFLFFPSGLVLYYFFSNLVTIAQQKLITWQFNKEVAAKKA